MELISFKFKKEVINPEEVLVSFLKKNFFFAKEEWFLLKRDEKMYPPGFRE